jgi:hypothetical protein
MKKKFGWTGCAWCEGIGKDRDGVKCAWCGGTGTLCAECLRPPKLDAKGKPIDNGGCWHHDR